VGQGVVGTPCKDEGKEEIEQYGNDEDALLVSGGQVIGVNYVDGCGVKGGEEGGEFGRRSGERWGNRGGF